MQRLRARLVGLLGRRRGGAWRTRSDPVRGRRCALREEVGYWDEWLSTGGGKYAEEYAYRFDPAAEVADAALREVLAMIAQGVGARALRGRMGRACPQSQELRVR